LCVLVGVVGKLLSELDLIEFISQFSKLKWGRCGENHIMGGLSLAILRHLHKI
jgi:hypothetical protein